MLQIKNVINLFDILKVDTTIKSVVDEGNKDSTSSQSEDPQEARETTKRKASDALDELSPPSKQSKPETKTKTKTKEGGDTKKRRKKKQKHKNKEIPELRVLSK